MVVVEPSTTSIGYEKNRHQFHFRNECIARRPTLGVKESTELFFFYFPDIPGGEN